MGCTCFAEKESLKKKVTKGFHQSDLIFTGNVIEVEPISRSERVQSSADPVIYTFEIIKKIKGVFEKRVIEIVSARGGSSCGYTFQIGKTYMVYANQSNYYSTTTKNENDYTTNICKRNNHVARVTKKEKRILDRMSIKVSKNTSKS